MTFLKARDGFPICSVRSVLLHSAYNPEREAQKFACALDVPFVPQFVVITEPAVSYTAQFLRHKFPRAKLFAVRYCSDFQKWDALWDGVFYVETQQDDGGCSKLKTSLFNAFGEEGLLSTFFCAWQPSARAFQRTDAAAWRAIRDAVSLSRDILATRTRFASRWVINAFSLCAGMRQAAGAEKGTAPIVVAASGASLESSLPFLKKYRGKYFLIALSSALMPLCRAGVECGLCLSTDGGFYAGSHLSPLITSMKVPLAIVAEGYCPPGVLENSPIIPLVYPDGPASAIVKKCAPLAAVTAERNGTVSGTALRLALSLTTGNVYFCGLDMAGGAGRQHCPPNALDTQESAHDTRLHTAEVRRASSYFASSALEIYRKWFASLEAEEVRRVFRLSDNYQYGNTLGHIRDVNFDHFNQCLERCNGGAEGQGCTFLLPRIVLRPLPSAEERRKTALSFVLEQGGTQEWLHEIFPADCIACERSGTKTEHEKAEALLQKKNDALLKKIHRLLGDAGAKQ